MTKPHHSDGEYNSASSGDAVERPRSTSQQPRHHQGDTATQEFQRPSQQGASKRQQASATATHSQNAWAGWQGISRTLGRIIRRPPQSPSREIPGDFIGTDL